MPSVNQILEKAAEFFIEKNAGYGDAYKRQPKILFEMLGKIELNNVDDYERFLRVTSVITKLNRYCTSFKEGGHLDSAADLVIFSAMLQELAHKELPDGEIK
jgi:hypothetical protein